MSCTSTHIVRVRLRPRVYREIEIPSEKGVVSWLASWLWVLAAVLTVTSGVGSVILWCIGLPLDAFAAQRRHSHETSAQGKPLMRVARQTGA